VVMVTLVARATLVVLRGDFERTRRLRWKTRRKRAQAARLREGRVPAPPAEGLDSAPGNKYVTFWKFAASGQESTRLYSYAAHVKGLIGKVDRHHQCS
jgi:hypothetical protein